MATKKRPVIDDDNLPTRLPYAGTLATVVALHVFRAPEWLYGAVILFLLIVWLGAVIRLAGEASCVIRGDGTLWPK